MTLVKSVEALHQTLWEDDRYRRYLEATTDAEAVEGTIAIDNILAAELIREAARRQGDLVLSKANLTAISKALNVVMRRYGVSRKERANSKAKQEQT